MADQAVPDPHDLQMSPRRSAADLAGAMARRIRGGEFLAGDALPSCRQLARELHMDKNTVSKAYKMLEEHGLIRIVAGRGAFVSKQFVPAASPEHLQQIQKSLEAVIWQARAFGVEADALWKIVRDGIWRFYEDARVAVALLECNAYEAQHMSKQLEDVLGVPVTPLLLADFLARVEHYTSTFDVLVTTLHHLSVVSAAAGEEADRVVGLHSVPTPAGALAIARAPCGSRLGVVCSTEPSVESLTSLVRSYNAEIEVYSHLVTNTAGLAEFIAGVDLIVDTISTHDYILELSPPVPAITIAFRIEAQSIDFLKAQLMAITRARVAQAA